jgi:hypothetical protein
MGKVLVVILATMAALWIAFLVVGPKMGETAFHLPHFHTAVSWMVVAGACVGFGFYKLVKGK